MNGLKSVKHTLIHTHTTEYYSSLKKKEILPLVTDDQPAGHCTEGTAPKQRDKYCMISLMCGLK